MTTWNRAKHPTDGKNSKPKNETQWEIRSWSEYFEWERRGHGEFALNLNSLGRMDKVGQRKCQLN